jgi:cyclic-di-AMP phosphodiesterase PgpH
MKIRLTKERLDLSIKLLIFLGVILIISYLLPNQNRFKYFFEQGKPWSYDLIMAPFDFPVYKSDKQIQQEKSKLLEGFIPFFKTDTTIVVKQLKKFLNDYQTEYQQSPDQLGYLERKWVKIYASGVISSEHFQKLKEQNITEINCIQPNKEINTLKLDNIFTPKSAYQYLMQDAPPDLSSYNINLYLIENLKFDSLITSLSKDEMLKNLSFTSGIVQSGERIIDRGEIVTETQFLVLNSMKKAYENKDTELKNTYLVSIGEIIIISGMIVLFFLYMYLFRPRIFENNNNLLFISLLIVIMISLVSLVTEYTDVSYFILPYALLPIIVRVFFDSRTALFAHIITTLIISLIVDNAFQFIMLQIAVGMTAVSSLKDMTQRSQLAQTALIILITYILTFLALELISEGDISRIHWEPVLYFAISSGFLLIAYLLIYIFEKIFGLVSAITLLELTNVNSDLMMQFAEKAPGTFQHTLQVSNLATEAAKKIGANSLLVRTGALYHDIGKMKNPQYFIENQMGGPNPLSDLKFEQAAQVIIGHVHDGIEIARKAHLPEQIIHFIGTHHGYSKTKYFYNSFINANPEIKPDDTLYTYPGPLPDTKETAILMMADAVEARARSLKVYTDESINECVEQMINSQIADGMFREAPISFRDVETVKEIFREKIRNMYHNRIVYPELNKK